MASVYSSLRDWPRRFAWYIAVSALRSSSTAASALPTPSTSCDDMIATPMLTESSTSTPFSITRPLSAWRTRSARSSEVCSSIVPSHSTTNSSPPMRATTSAGRVACSTRWATCTRRASPTSCPTVSLTSFNRSTSTNSIATLWRVPRMWSSASAAVRSSISRLGSPVSGSWLAWRVSSLWRCLVAVMSLATPPQYSMIPSAERCSRRSTSSVRSRPSGPRKPTSPDHTVDSEDDMISRGTWSRMAWSRPRAEGSRMRSTSCSTPNSSRAAALVNTGAPLRSRIRMASSAAPATAASRSSSCSPATASVLSRAVPEKPTRRLSRSRRGAASIRTQSIRPSPCQTRKLRLMSPPASTPRRQASSALARSPGWASAQGGPPRTEPNGPCTSAPKASLAAVMRPSGSAMKRPTGSEGSCSSMSAILVGPVAYQEVSARPTVG